MGKHGDYTEEMRWLQAMAKELAADDLRYRGVNFFQGLWGYKEVALFLGLSPQTVKKAEFRRILPAVALWQAKGRPGKSGHQVLRWRPSDVFGFREGREQQGKARIRRAG